MTRSLIASVGSLTVCFGAGKSVIASRASWAGLVTKLLLRKDGGKGGYIVDTRTCVGMEVRVCTGGDLGNGCL